MKGPFRKFIALCAVLGAVALLWWELPAFNAQSGEALFWLVIAILALIFGLVELFSKTPPKTK